MSKHVPIVLIEDDEEDYQIFEQVVREIGITNPIEWFRETKSALEYLLATDENVYLILSDINMPGRNGIDLKKQLDANVSLRRKSIPFLFYSTNANRETVNKAYTELTVQGFFKKQSSFDEMKKMLRTIFDYWETCRHPNNTDN